jgi:Bacterial extracellular solute-binding protein
MGKEQHMIKTSRRSVLRSSLTFAAAAALARPYLANATATTASAWWAQGFAQEEDVALRKIVADYGKASGNTIELSIVPFAPLRQKIISAMTSGSVPDLIDANPLEIVPEEAWNGRLVDVSDVVETQKEHYLPNALLSARCYDNTKKNNGAITASHTKVRCGRSITGGIWLRKQAIRSPIFRTLGTPLSISLNRCSRNCEIKACAMSMPPALSSAPWALTSPRPLTSS